MEKKKQGKRRPVRPITSGMGTAAKVQSTSIPESRQAPLKVTVKIPADELSNKALMEGRLTEYIVPVGESEDTVHVELEQTEFERNTGKKKSNPYVAKFNSKAWNGFRKACVGLGYIHVRVLYAPAGVDLEVIDPTKSK